MILKASFHLFARGLRKVRIFTSWYRDNPKWEKGQTKEPPVPGLCWLRICESGEFPQRFRTLLCLVSLASEETSLKEPSTTNLLLKHMVRPNASVELLCMAGLTELGLPGSGSSIAAAKGLAAIGSRSACACRT